MRDCEAFRRNAGVRPVAGTTSRLHHLAIWDVARGWWTGRAWRLRRWSKSGVGFRSRRNRTTGRSVVQTTMVLPIRRSPSGYALRAGRDQPGRHASGIATNTLQYGNTFQARRTTKSPGMTTTPRPAAQRGAARHAAQARLRQSPLAEGGLFSRRRHLFARNGSLTIDGDNHRGQAP